MHRLYLGQWNVRSRSISLSLSLSLSLSVCVCVCVCVFSMNSIDGASLHTDITHRRAPQSTSPTARPITRCPRGYTCMRDLTRSVCADSLTP